jgi:predicted RNA binding protein YcfA (HicA-like mRNA interferase family)
MTSIQKTLEKFLDNPKSLRYKDIETFLFKSGFVFEWWNWSHRIITSKKTGNHETIPIHNKDCKNVYKKKLMEFYLNNT